MNERTVIACTAEDIDMSLERWLKLTAPELCQQFGCMEEVDRECGWCRGLFCPGHGVHDCLRGKRSINEFGEATG